MGFLRGAGIHLEDKAARVLNHPLTGNFLLFTEKQKTLQNN